MNDALATRRACLIRLAALAAAMPIRRVRAADAAAPDLSASAAADTAPDALQAELVRTGLYLITGGGGNVLLRLSAAGAVLVNSKRAGQYRPLRSQLRKISRLSDLPVRVLVLTDTAEHHAANQALFAAAGVATLVQQRGVPMVPAALPMAASAPAAKAPAPVVTFDRDYHLLIGGVTVDLVHVGPVRTEADTLVHFPDLEVLAVGDLYTAALPAAAMTLAGDLAPWSQALARALLLDFDLFVPSVGPPLPRAELEAFKRRIDAGLAAQVRP